MPSNQTPTIDPVNEAVKVILKQFTDEIKALRDTIDQQENSINALTNVIEITTQYASDLNDQLEDYKRQREQHDNN